MRPSEPPAAGEPRAEDRRPRGENRASRKERLLKDDGRYIIFYDFGNKEERV